MACSDNSESYSLAMWIRGKTTEETASISESPAESSRQEEQTCKIYFYINYPLLSEVLNCFSGATAFYYDTDGAFAL